MFAGRKLCRGWRRSSRDVGLGILDRSTGAEEIGVAVRCDYVNIDQNHKI